MKCHLCGDTRDPYNWSRIIGICHHCRSYYRDWKELKDPRMLNSGIEFCKYLQTVTNSQIFVETLDNKLPRICLKHPPKNETRIDWDKLSGWTDNEMYMIPVYEY